MVRAALLAVVLCGCDRIFDMFFATAQSGPGGNCSDGATDDFQGCGTYGLPAQANCLPLDKTASNMCDPILGAGAWDCPVYNNEVNTVTKMDATTGGGVLCCRDS